MAVLSEILAALNAWPKWKALSELPEKVAALEARLVALEGAPKAAPGQPCPSCGARAFRVTGSRKSDGPFGELGAMSRNYKCSACGFTETRDVDD